MRQSRQDIASTNEELDAVRASKSEADEALLAKDKENVKVSICTHGGETEAKYTKYSYV